VVDKWQAIVLADDTQQFATFKKRIAQFVEFRAELVRRANEISPAAVIYLDDDPSGGGGGRKRHSATC